MNTNKIEYTGSAYIGVAGGELEIGDARDTLHQLVRREGDGTLVFARATKGYEARQTHVNKFMESKHDFLLLLDHDMKFQPDTLERLRSHKLPFVSGLYMRRNWQPMMPVWYRPWVGKWPLEPWVGRVERNKLHPLGASGWGCILVHRQTILAVRKLLKGEWDVLEDDMDVWPYDPAAIVRAIAGLRLLLSERPSMSTLLPALEQHTRSLEGEFRLNRGDKSDIIGSDIRFAWYAAQAGFQLMGDPEVRPGHYVEYPFSGDDYDSFSEDELKQAEQGAHKDIKRIRAEFEKKVRAKYE